MRRYGKKGLLMGMASLFLCLLMFLQVPIGAAEAVLLDYGRGTGDRTLTASQLFEALFGETKEVALTAGEQAALDALADVSMTYAGVPDSVIQREYDGDTGILTILVSPYSYTARNGETVLWIPQTLSFNGGAPTVLTLGEDGIYRCSFSGLNNSMKFTLDVDFLWQVEIEAEIANTLLTLPYSIGQQAWADLEPYATYQAAQQAYDSYLAAKKAYDSNKAAYDAYTAKKAAYDTKKAAYDAYLTAKAAYEAAVKAYKANEEKKQAYQTAEKAYFEYQAFRQQHAALYDEYEVYLATMEKMKADLKILDSAYVYVSEIPWSYYLSIKGPTAMSFLDTLSQNEHLIGSAMKKVVDEARSVGARLTELLIAYDKVSNASYTSSFERTTAKYDFYTRNYEELCYLFKTFYLDMERIYCDGGVQGALAIFNKDRQLQIMIAQSYSIYAALDNKITLDPNWELKVVKTYKALNDILHEKHRLTDSDNASPKGVTIPTKEVKLPDSSFLKPVEKPVKDYDENLVDPALQGAPEPVANPGSAPAVVANPGNAPAVVQKPEGECPAKPVQTAIENALALEFQKGILPKRQERTSAQLLSLHHRVKCTREFSNRKTVTFYDTDGVTKIYETTVEFNQKLSTVTFPSPEKAGDERYSEYRFLGWIFCGSVDNGVYLDPSTIRVDEDLAICASYQTVDRLYKITWMLGSRRVETFHRYGEIPTYSGSTVHPDGDKASIYTFRGWSPLVEAVTAEATYTADYLRPSYTVTWIVGDKQYETQVLHGDCPVPVATDRTTDDRIYVFNRWNADITKPITSNRTFRAIYDEKLLGSYDGGNTSTPVPVEHTENGIILRPERSEFWVVNAISYAIGNHLDLTVAWENLSVTYTKAQLETLLNGGCVRFQLLIDNNPIGGQNIQLHFRDKHNNPLPLAVKGEVTLSMPARDGLIGMLYTVSDGVETPIEVTRYNDGRLVLDYDGVSQLIYRPEYRVQFTDPTENSNLSALPTQIAPGTTVDLNVNCEYGYEVTGATLLYGDGRTEEIVGTQFVMPDASVSVQVKVERIAYKFTFMVGDTVYTVLNFFFGDTVVLPENPVKESDGEFTYTFGGWSGNIPKTAVQENRNPVYTAEFIKEAIQSTAADSYQGSLLVRIVIIGVLFVALVVGVILCIVKRKKLRAFFRRIRGKDVAAQEAVAEMPVAEFESTLEITSESDTEDGDNGNGAE